MADNADIATDLMRLNEEERARQNETGYPVAVAWKLHDGTIIARIIPDLTTVTKAKYDYLEKEKGLDIGEDPWAVVYRKGDNVVTSGYAELKEKALEVFTAKEHLVPC